MMMRERSMNKMLSIAVVFSLAVLYPIFALSEDPGEGLLPEVQHPAYHDVSGKLREIKPERSKRGERTREVLLLDGHRFHPPQDDPVRQQGAGFGVATTPGLGFDGIGLPNYAVNAAPPDPNGAAGLTQYVQWVNEDFAVFDKGT